MSTIDISAGTIHYEAAGPENGGLSSSSTAT